MGFLHVLVCVSPCDDSSFLQMMLTYVHSGVLLIFSYGIMSQPLMLDFISQECSVWHEVFWLEDGMV